MVLFQTQKHHNSANKATSTIPKVNESFLTFWQTVMHSVKLDLRMRSIFFQFDHVAKKPFC